MRTMIQGEYMMGGSRSAAICSLFAQRLSNHGQILGWSFANVGKSRWCLGCSWRQGGRDCHQVLWSRLAMRPSIAVFVLRTS